MPRFWHGMALGPWFRLLARNRFRVGPTRLPMALIISGCSAASTVGAWQEKLVYGRLLRKARERRDPLFVIGHWRTGTTFMHELLVQDPRFTFPTTYQVSAPHHFLSSSWCIRPLLKFLLPKRRVMDNMAFGGDTPQEDEFALCTMGVPSPYVNMAWPNLNQRCDGSLELDPLDPDDAAAWKAGMRYFLSKLALKDRRRVVLKSPTHTARVATLLDMFPKARFVHLVRNPYRTFRSTLHMWKTMQAVCGLQVPRYEHLEDYLFDMYERMYYCFERDRGAIDSDCICDVKYEDLVNDPIGELARVYQHLGLEGFDKENPRLREYVNSKKGYRTNVLSLDARLRERIADRWSDYFDRYGYSKDIAEAI
ncbi:MAG: sulfotransferase family protein [Planctomycetota bacterium]